jgi:hypothetical protein
MKVLAKGSGEAVVANKIILVPITDDVESEESLQLILSMSEVTPFGDSFGARLEFSIESDAAVGTLTLDTNPIADDTMTVGDKVYTFKGPLVTAVASQGTLSMPTNPSDGDTMTVDEKVYTFKGPLAAAVASQGTLTLDTNPVDGDTMTVDAKVYTFKGPLVDAVASQGTLTLDTNPTDGDTMTVDARVYTFEDTLTDVDGNIKIGIDLAATKLNLVAAFDLSGTAGVDYATSMTAHATVTIASFVGDDAVLTAVTPGVAGDSIVTTETFNEVTNVFDAATLGTTTAGVDAVTVANVNGNIIIGANLAATKLSLVAAFDLSGVSGVDYAAAMTAHPTVTIATFIGNDAILTAKVAGVAGDLIATTETFDEVTNVFDAATLGTTTAGAAAVTVADVDGNVIIGANVAATRASLVAAFDRSGVMEVDYARKMTVHPTVNIAAFIGNDAILTAKTAGVAGDLIATTETFTPAGNIFDAATLGTTTAGVDAVTVSNVDGNIIIGADLAATKLSLVAAFDLSGVAGVDYAAAMTAHRDVDIAAFVTDDAVLTAKVIGPLGDRIGTTETFDEATNVFSAPTLLSTWITSAGNNDIDANADGVTIAEFSRIGSYIRMVFDAEGAAGTANYAFMILG